MHTIESCQIVELPRITDARGSLSFVEGGRHIPFAIERVFYIYDVPTGEHRGGHAHKTLHQFLICLAGAFSVELDDGSSRLMVELWKPWTGLYIPPMIWEHDIDFRPGSVCVVLASHVYDPDDYIRDHREYIDLRQAHYSR